jgi:hypothetical protein
MRNYQRIYPAVFLNGLMLCAFQPYTSNARVKLLGTVSP